MYLGHRQYAQIVFKLTPSDALLSVVTTDIFISESHPPPQFYISKSGTVFEEKESQNCFPISGS